MLFEVELSGYPPKKKYDTEEWLSVLDFIFTLNQNRRYGIVHPSPFKISPRTINLAKKIEQDLGIYVFPVIFRNYPGRHQRSAGAWNFYMFTSRLLSIGTCDTIQMLLRKNVKLEILERTDEFLAV